MGECSIDESVLSPEEKIAISSFQDRGIKLTPAMVDGQVVVSAKDFGMMTGRSVISIYKLIKEGNRLRKLKSIELPKAKLVPLSEYWEFPFTSMRKGEVYMFTPDGKEILRTPQNPKGIIVG